MKKRHNGPDYRMASITANRTQKRTGPAARQSWPSEKVSRAIGKSEKARYC